MGRPSFIIIGAERCGTTSLYHNICKHSKVHPAYQKEIEFFDKHYDKGVDWYHLQFQKIPGSITGEATPTYYWNPKAPERIRAYDPDMKLIFLYRQPVEAIKSKYLQQVSKGVETLTFEDALKYEEIRIAGSLERTRMLPYNHYPLFYSEYAYKDRYWYNKHMIAWEGFNLLKIKSEDFFDNMDKTMQKVFDFLGLNFERYEWEHLNKSVCAESSER